LISMEEFYHQTTMLEQVWSSIGRSWSWLVKGENGMPFDCYICD
jgi:hypothetical protein